MLQWVMYKEKNGSPIEEGYFVGRKFLLLDWQPFPYFLKWFTFHYFNRFEDTTISKNILWALWFLKLWKNSVPNGNADWPVTISLQLDAPIKMCFEAKERNITASYFKIRAWWDFSDISFPIFLNKISKKSPCFLTSFSLFIINSIYWIVVAFRCLSQVGTPLY